MPGEAVFDDLNMTEAFSYKMSNDIVTKIRPSKHEELLFVQDSCWRPAIHDGCLPDYRYYKGLGGPYFKCDNAFSLGGEENSLEYFKKGNTSWGSPLIFTGISNQVQNNKIIVYPNPFSSNISVDIGLPDPHDLTIEFTNILGQLISRKQIPDNISKHIVLTGSWMKGIYLYRVVKNGNTIQSGKLVKVK